MGNMEVPMMVTGELRGRARASSRPVMGEAVGLAGWHQISHQLLTRRN